MGVPPGFELGTSHTTMYCPPMARHSDVAAQAAISCPYETPFCDVIGLSAFSSLPLIGFCWTAKGYVATLASLLSTLFGETCIPVCILIVNL